MPVSLRRSVVGVHEQGVPTLLDTLAHRYPNVNPYRYVPGLPRFTDL